MKSLVVGQAGREGILGVRMAERSALHVVMEHANPTLADAAERSGGRVQLGGTCDPESVARFALDSGVDIAMVSADDPLAAGVVDALRDVGIATVGPTRAGAEIEWNKEFARAVLAEVAPDANPRMAAATTPAEIDAALERFGGDPVVVKPVGLTGGKGVKVMGPHLDGYDDVRAYAGEIFAGRARGGTVLLEERLRGLEFTIQAITDGVTTVFPPATYDYPYRRDGDSGPGTGGMGCFTGEGRLLPLLEQSEYDRGCEIVTRVLAHLKAEGRHFSGVMNAGFFATPAGVKVVEFNARFGDPECLNILSLFEGDWLRVMRGIWDGALQAADVRLRPHASVVTYLVSPGYAYGPGEPTEFTLDAAAAARAGCEPIFHTSERIAGDRYRTRGTARAVAICATAPSLADARARVASGIAAALDGPLEWRRDIGSEEYIATHLRPA
jgi:phosphoribosylamine--glycine ligase